MSTSTGPFSFISSPQHLASALGVQLDELLTVKALIAAGSAYDYRRKSIHGKIRALAVPTERVGSLQRRITDFLWPLSLELHPACHGYTSDHSTKTNAAPHCGALWVQRLDIQDFYPSTDRSKIILALSAVGSNKEIAEAISDLVTDKNCLPLGAPSSPLISNLVLTPLDAALAGAASSGGLSYTRYADDLTFSSNAAFDMTEIATLALGELGFKLNPNKSRLRRRGQSIAVTGLRVSEPDYPRLPKQFKRRLRQEFYFIQRFGFAEHCQSRYSWHWIDEEDEERQLEQSRRHLQGKVHYALGIERKWAASLLTAYPASASELVPPIGYLVAQRRTALATLSTEIKDRPHVPLSRQLVHVG